MTEGGKILREVVEELLPFVKQGITTNVVDAKAYDIIIKKGAQPSFTQVKGYKWTTCLPINEQIVHTPPSDRILELGDVLTIDIGVFYKGYHTDYATTVVIGGKATNEIKKFLEIGKQTLEKAIQVVKEDGYTGEISQVIQTEIEKNGYKILRELTGHGIGKELHEDPFIPGFLEKAVTKTHKIKSGLVVAIEIIYSMSTEEIAYEIGNNWSIITSDGSISACFEKTIAVLDKKVFVLT